MNEETSRMSLPERKVAQYLRHINIEWTYEQPVFIWDEIDRPRVWTPDFYLPQFGIYIEVCGSKDFNYEYRKRIFLKNGHYVIFLEVFKGEKKWLYYFKKSLSYYLMKRLHKFSKLNF